MDRPDRLGIVHIAPAVGKAIEEKRPADGPATKSHRAHFDAAVPQCPFHHAHFFLVASLKCPRISDKTNVIISGKMAWETEPIPRNFHRAIGWSGSRVLRQGFGRSRKRACWLARTGRKARWRDGGADSAGS